MKDFKQFLFLALALVALASCNKVQFSKVTPSTDCRLDGTCPVEFNRFSEVLTVPRPSVDILFVVDNSASMSFEQNSIGSKFQDFLQKLDSKNLDYRIGITTTDISSPSNVARPINSNGALQDGRLIDLGGVQILDSTLVDRQARFSNYIRRPETLNCETFIANWVAGNRGPIGSSEYSTGYYSNCPSGDERGIYAANLSLQNYFSRIMRPQAALAVVFIGDEDVRSDGLNLDLNWDTPTSFVNRTRSQYGANKQVTVHSVMVRPGDVACKNLQSQQVLGGVPSTAGMISANYGYFYSEFVSMQLGLMGDICSNDYGRELGEIAGNILTTVSKVQLRCSTPTNVVVTFTPPNTASEYSVIGSEVRFKTPLISGSSVKVEYSCPK